MKNIGMIVSAMFSGFLNKKQENICGGKTRNSFLIPTVLILCCAAGARGQSFEVIPSSGPFDGGNIVVFTNVVPAIGNGSDIHNVSIGGRLTRRWVDSPEIIDQGPNWVSFIAPPGVLAGITTNIRTQGTSVRSRIENQVYTYYPRGTIGSQTGRWRPVGQDFAPGSTNAIGMAGGVTRVRALHWDHERNVLFAGGTFTNAGGTNIDGIAYWDGTAWNRMGTGIGTTRYVRCILPAPDGKVYAGGFFPEIGSATSRNVAAWCEDIQDWESLGEGPTYAQWSVGNVHQLHWRAPDDIIAVGEFTNHGWQAATPASRLGCIARWNGSAWTRMDDAGDFRLHVHSLAVSPGTHFSPAGELFVGGWFTNHFPLEASEHMNAMARWDEGASTWQPVGRGITGAARRVYTMMFGRDGNLYVGGNFTHARNADGTEVEANRVAMWDGNEWSSLGEGAQGNGFGWDNVYQMAQCNDGYIYAVGDFTNIGFRAAGGPAANGFARWDGTNWSPVGAGLSHDVWAITINTNNNDIYVGGRFTHGLHEDGSVAHTWRVARWDWDEPSHGVEPASGPLAGGYTVTISGRGLGNGTDITNVTLAGVQATIVSQSETQVVVTAGSTEVEGPGAVEVYSTTRGLSVKEDAFTYEAGQLGVYIPLPPEPLPPGHGAMLWQDFETPFTSSNTPAGGYPSFGWSKAVISNQAEWAWATNGLNNQPSGARGGAWANPTLGTRDRFALLGAGTKGNITRLFSPPVDMRRFSATPTMTFWHVQSPWIPDQDRLKVSYTTEFSWDIATNAVNAGQSGATPGWQTLGYWDTATSEWAERKIGLPDLTDHANVVFMFEAVGDRGRGVGIDDLMVSGPMDGLPLSEQTVTNLWQDFETPWVNNAPAGGYPETGWSRVFVSNTYNWVQATNGLQRRPPGTRPNPWVNPDTGTSNYIARINADRLGCWTRLITPALDLSGAQSVEMSFWHYQERWRFYFDWLLVRVTTNFNESMATNGSGVGWTTLMVQTNSILAWTNQVLSVPVSEVGPDTVFCFEFRSGYAYGVYLDDLKIVSDVLNVIPVDSGEITLGSNTLSFVADFDGPNPAGQTFTVSNSGEAEINWNGVGSKPWLTVTPAGGQLAPGDSVEVTAQVDVSGVPVGPHGGHLIFVADEARNSAQLVDVSLEVEKISQTITFPGIAPQHVASTTTVSATTTSGLDVEFEVVSGPGSLTGPTSPTSLTYTDTGLVKIEAVQAGDDTYEPAAVTNAVKVWSLSADIGPLAGGNAVTVNCGAIGNGADITSVTVGGIEAARGAQTANSIEITMPAQGTPGLRDIVITSTSEGETTLANAYAYNPAGAITLVDPAEGSAGGGFTVTISGINLTSASDVSDLSDLSDVTLAGVSAASVVSVSSTQIVVVAGASGSGAVTGDVVVVSTSFGETTDTDAFEYISVPEMLVLGTNGAAVANDAAPSAERGTEFSKIIFESAPVPHTFAITNNGTAELTIDPVALSDDTHFGVAGVPATVAAGTVSNFTITYDPQTVGDHSAVLYLTNNATTVYTVNLAGGAAQVIPDNGRLSGGNSVTVTNGVLGSGGDIFKVTVGGREAGITAQGASWVTFTVASNETAGLKEVVIESLSKGVTALPDAYTVNEPGSIEETTGERLADYRVNFKPDEGGNPLYEDMVSGDGTTNIWTWYNIGRVGDTVRLMSTDSLMSNAFLTAYNYNKEYASLGITYNPTNWISQPAATNFLYNDAVGATNRVVVTNLPGSNYRVDFFGGHHSTGNNSYRFNTKLFEGIWSEGDSIDGGSWGTNASAWQNPGGGGNNMDATNAANHASRYVTWTNVAPENGAITMVQWDGTGGNLNWFKFLNMIRISGMEPYGEALPAVSPTNSPIDGGIEVTISGTNLCDGTVGDVLWVELCGVRATEIVSASSTQIVVMAGAASEPGPGSVRVMSESRGLAELADAFNYLPRSVNFELLGIDGLAIESEAVVSSASGTDFGKVRSDRSVTNIFALVNNGAEDLEITSWDKTGDGAARFMLSGLPGAVEPGGSSNIVAVFAPAEVGVFTAAVVAVNNSTNFPSYTLYLAGEGIDAIGGDISVLGKDDAEIASGDAASVEKGTDFGATHWQSVVTNTFRIANSDEVLDLAITSWTTNGPGAGAFVVEGMPANVVPNDVAEFKVVFSPTDAVTHPAWISIINSDDSPFILNLAGTGLSANLAATPGGDFGPVLTGQTSNRMFSITNSGDAAWIIAGWTTNGADAASFTVEDVPERIETGTASNILVRFTPASGGAKSAELVFEGDAAAGNFTLNLSGSGLNQPRFVLLGTNGVPIESGAGVSPESGTDAGLLYPDETVTRTFTITNSGSAALVVTGSELTGDGTAAFAMDPLNFEVPAGDTRTFDVTVSPPASGVYTATVAAAGNMPDGVYHLNLEVQGFDPRISVFSTNNGDFGYVRAGTEADSVFVITNAGADTLTLAGGGISDSRFQISDMPASVAADSAGNFTVQFAPTEPGDYQAVLTITNNTLSGVYTTQLAGAAFSITPDNGPQEGGTVVTVTAGLIGNGSDITAVTVGGLAARLDAQGTNQVTFTVDASETPDVKDVVITSASLGTTTLHGAFTVNPAGVIGFWESDPATNWNWQSVGSRIVPQQYTAIGADKQVRALHWDDGLLYAGGDFDNIGGLDISRVAYFERGEWHGFGDAAVQGSVNAVVPYGDGVVAGGDFTAIGGVQVRGIARWTGAEWAKFGAGAGLEFTPGAVGRANSIVLYTNNSFVVGGYFTNVNGLAGMNHIALFDGSSWENLGAGFSNEVNALAVAPDDTLYAGGSFTDAGSYRVARWDAAAGNWENVGSGFNGAIRALAVGGDGTLYAGGSFTDAGSYRVKRWDDGAGAWENVGDGFNDSVNTLAVCVDGKLYAGGDFNSVGIRTANRVAMWDGESWVNMAQGLWFGASPAARALAVSGHDGSVFAGGDFRRAGASNYWNVARWTPTLVGWNTGVSPSSGSGVGGYPVTITGTNLVADAGDVTSVTICGANVEEIVSVTSTQIVVTAGPAVTDGLGDVVVDSIRFGRTIARDSFTYNAPLLKVLGTDGEEIESDAGVSPANGTRFPHVALGASWTNTFAIANEGGEDLALAGFGISDSRYQISDMPEMVEIGGVSNFMVRFTPDGAGDFPTAVTITNNSPGSLFTLNLAGACYTVMPDNGPLAGGNSITIENGNFGTITGVLVDGQSVTPTASGSSWFTITMPPAATAGTVDIVVQVLNGDDILLRDAYTYNPAGSITLVDPPTGSWTGGDRTVIIGANLGNGGDITNVTLAGVSAVIESQSAAHIELVAGAAPAPGSGDVRVFSTSHGETVKSNAFTYTGAGMTVHGLHDALIPSDSAASLTAGTYFGHRLPNQPVTNFFTIRNDGDAELVLTGHNVLGSGFEISGMPGSIPAGATGQFSVVFSSSAVGKYPAKLRISNNSPDAPYMLNLEGGIYAIDPDNGPYAGGNAVTITSGALGNGSDISIVLVGDVTATILAQTADSVIFEAPAQQAAGTFDIQIHSASVGVAFMSDAYTYNPPGMIFGAEDWTTWEEVAGLPLPKDSLAAGTFNGSLYAIGGSLNGTVMDSVYRFTGFNWVEAGNLPEGRSGISAAVYQDEEFEEFVFLHLPGGFDMEGVAWSSDRVFDGTEWAVSEEGPDRGAYAIGTHTNKLILAGGQSAQDGNSLSDVYQYDGETWTSIQAKLPAPRHGLAAGRQGESLYFLGGYLKDGANISVNDNVYRFEGSSFNSVESLPAPRAELAAATLDDKLYAIGGFYNNRPWTNVWHFNGTNWAEAPGLPAARQALAAATLDGAIYAVGGSDGTASVTNVFRYPARETGVDPDSGSMLGGFEVVISGANLGDGSDITSVTLAGVNAAIQSQSSTQVVVTAAVGTPGTGDVRVYSTRFGETVRDDAFTYLTTPEIVVLGTNAQDIASGEAASGAKGTDFGVLFAGDNRTHVLTVTNSGDMELTMEWTTNGTDAAAFVVETANAVPPHSAVPLTVNYAPVTVGAHAASVVIANNSTNGPFILNLAGEMIDPQIALIGADGASYADNEPPTVAMGTDFGMVATGAHVQVTLAITNFGQTALSISGYSLTGQEADAFSVSNLPVNIAAGASEPFELHFQPQVMGSHALTLTLTNNTADEVFRVRATGIGARAGQIGLTRSALTFNGIFGGTVLAPEIYAITNRGDITFSYTNVLNYGAGASDWLTLSRYSGTLEAGQFHTTTGTVNIAGLDADTYTVTNTITSDEAGNSPVELVVELIVHKAPQTIDFPNPGAQITTNTTALAATSDSELPVTFTVASGPATLSDLTNLTYQTDGTVTIVASQAGDANWLAAASVTQSFAVTKAIADVSFTNLSQTYDGAARVAGTQTTPDSLDVKVLYEGEPFAPVNAGSYSVLATVSDALWQGGATGTLDVAQATQSITNFVPANESVFVITNTVTLNAQASSGLQPVYSILSGPGVIDINTLTFTNEGTVQVVAEQSGNVNWEAAEPVTNSYTVNKADAEIELGYLEQTYDGSNKAVLVWIDPMGLEVVTTYDGLTNLPVNAGAYAVTSVVNDVIYQGTATGTLEIVKAEQTIDFANPGQQITTNTIGLSATASSGLQVTFTVESGPGSIAGDTNLTFNNSGTVAIVASQAGDTNWLAAAVTQSFAVVKAAQAPLTFTPATPQIFGTTNQLSAEDGSGTGGFSFVIQSGSERGRIEDGTNLVATSGSGQIVVMVVKAADNLYEQASMLATVICARASQIIDFPGIGEQHLTNHFGLDATATSGLNVGYEVVSGPAQLSGVTNLTFSGTGTVHVAALQAGDANYAPAPTLTNYFEVYAGELLITTTNGAIIATNAPASWDLGTDLGAVPTNETLTLSILLTNSSPDRATYITNVTTNGSAFFSISNVPPDLASGAVATSTVHYVPAALGLHEASFVIANDTLKDPYVLNVSGVGVQPGELALRSSKITWKTSYGDTNPVPRYFEVGNTGDVAIVYDMEIHYDDSGADWVTLSATTGELPGTSWVGFTGTVSAVGFNAGTYMATNIISAPDAINTPQYMIFEMFVDKAAQTIEFAPIPAQQTTNQVGLSATASSGMPVTFGVMPGSPAILSGGTNLAFTGPGTVRVTASQAGNTNWNAAPTITNVFAVTKVGADVTISNTNQIYNGSVRPVTVTTVPAGLGLLVTYDESFDIPVNVGSYNVVAIVDDDYYQGGATGTLVVAKADGGITLTNLVQTYDGTARSVGATTAPSGMTVNFTYDGNAWAPTNAGSYTIVGTLDDANYQGSTTGTLVIAKAMASVTLTNLVQTYDGTAREISATTDPIGLMVEFTYNGNAWAPTNAGIYAVTGTVDEVNLQGSAQGMLVVRKINQTITFDPFAAPFKTSAAVGLSATGGDSGNPVTFAVGSGPGIIAGGTNLTFTDAGDVAVVASQAGTLNYNPAHNVTNIAKVFRVTPDNGPYYAPSNSVTVTNGLFGTITNVLVNGTAVTVENSHDTWFTISIPGADGPGAVDIVVQTFDNGEFTLADAYTYNTAGVIGGHVWDWSVWEAAPGLPEPWLFPAAATYSNKLFVVSTNRALSFDGTNWNEEASLPVNVRRCGVAVHDGGLYSVGGQPSITNVFRFDGSDWSETAGLPAGRQHVLAASVSNYLYSIGGNASGGTRTNVYRFDGAVWSEVPGMPSVMVELWGASPQESTAFLSGGMVDGLFYIAGGALPRTNAYSYDGTVFEPVAGLPAPRAWAAAASLNDALHVFGGVSEEFPLVAQNTHYRFDGANWSEAPPLTNAVCHHGGAMFRDQIYAIGGRNNENTWVTNVWRYPARIELEPVVPSEGSWTGGYEVVISGSNLGNGTDVTNVTLCGVNATIVSQSTTQIVVTAGKTATRGIGDVRVFSASYGETVKSNGFTYTASEVHILGINGAVIESGEAASPTKGTDFGELVWGNDLTHTFAITNSGNEALKISGVANPDSGFKVSGMPETVDIGSVSSFTIAFAPLSAGTFSATVEIANNSPSVSYVLNLAGEALKKDQTIMFDQIPDQEMSSVLELSATASSGLPVTFKVVDGPAVLTGSSVSFTGTGAVSVAASQVGDDNWNPAPDVTNTFNVTKDAPSDIAVFGDYTGDGQTDMAVYDMASGIWYICDIYGNLVTWAAHWGGPGYVPVPGDYTGDGVNDLAVYGTADGLWYIATLDGRMIVHGARWGGPGFIPVAGDYDGSGIYDMAVYDLFTGNWYIRGVNEPNLKSQISNIQPEADQPLAEKSEIEPTAQWGGPSMLPVSGDYDGDGIYDLAVYEQASGNWFVRFADEAMRAAQFGGPGFAHVSGDFNGDGRHDLAVYHQASGMWYVMDIDGEIIVWAEQWGGAGFAPLSGDYTGDGKSDLAVYDMVTGQWYIRTLDGTVIVNGAQWGGSGFLPVMEADAAMRPAGLSAVYRVYSFGYPGETLEHFITADRAEAEALASTPYWIDEGIAWFALTSGSGDAFPLYRVYNTVDRGHYYTLDATLYNTLVSQGWSGEGVGMYVWATASGGRVPVYQFYNEAIQQHLFTADANEKRALIAEPAYGYAYQGIAFYVY